MGEVVAVRPLAVKKGSEEGFEKFVTSRIYPAFQNHVPGVHSYVYKGDRGENKGLYINLYVFESVEVRNTYFPAEGADINEMYASHWEAVSHITDEMVAFIDTSQVVVYTDYVSINNVPEAGAGRSAMDELASQEVYWFLELAINDGKKDAFMEMMYDMVTATRMDEPGTLNYEWNLSDDGKTCYIYERYSNSAAVMTHLGNFGAKFAERFTANVTPTKFMLFGAPSEEVKQALAGAGAVAQKPIGGFAR